ncbi:MAG: hypothetical protein KDI09_21290 [Halioglobus sp.]|nr:hypothetical protein [Halioglobus sp.]
MSDTVKIQRPNGPRKKVTVDDRGRSVWAGTVETANLELVSTSILKKLLADDEQQRDAVTELAATNPNGYLAKDNATGMFRIIDDDDLQSLLDSNAAPEAFTRPADVVLEPVNPLLQDDEELALVSTQALRKILDIPDNKNKKASPSPVKDKAGGFDPYNTG